MNFVLPASRKPVKRYTGNGSLFNAKQLLQCVLIDLGTYYADTTRDIRRAGTDILLFRDIVKVDPAAVFAVHIAFGTEDGAELLPVLKGIKDIGKFLFGILAGSFKAP